MNALSAGSLLSYEPADTSGPILEMTIGDALRAAAAAWPDRPALIEGLSKQALRRRWTFTQALQEAEKPAERSRSASGLASTWRSGPRTCRSGSSPNSAPHSRASPSSRSIPPTWPPNSPMSSSSRAHAAFWCRTITAVVTFWLPLPRRGRYCRPYAKSFPSRVGPNSQQGARGKERCRKFSPGTSRSTSTRPEPRARRRGRRLTHRNLVNNGRFYARTIGAGETDILAIRCRCSHRRLRALHAWRFADGWVAGDAAGFRSRTDA